MKCTKLATLLSLSAALCFAGTLPGIFDNDYATGTNLGNGDDSTFGFTLPAAFNYLGTNYTNGFVSTNGFLTFGATDPTPQCCAGTPSLLVNGQPRLAVFFNDLVTTVYESSYADHTSFTWSGTGFNNAVPDLMQIQVYT